MAEVFDDFGFDFFGEVESAKKETKKVAPKAEKKEAKKTEKKASTSKTAATGNDKAKKLKLQMPVVVKGRNWQVRLTGEGEKSVQEIAQSLINAGYVELKHEHIKFYKAADSELLVVYALTGTDDNMSVELPVTVADGQKKAEYKEASEFDAEEDDEISISDLRKKSIPEEMYENLLIDYDPAAKVAIPVFRNLTEKEVGANVKVGDRVNVYGTVKSVADTSTAVPDLLGEVPEGCKAVWRQAKGIYSLCIEPEAKELHGPNTVSVDRTVFGIKEAKKAAAVKEMIYLPVNCQYGLAQVTYTSDNFDGKDKVSWEDFLDTLKKEDPAMFSAERVKNLDKVYEKDKNLLRLIPGGSRKGAI